MRRVNLSKDPSPTTVIRLLQECLMKLNNKDLPIGEARKDVCANLHTAIADLQQLQGIGLDNRNAQANLKAMQRALQLLRERVQEMELERAANSTALLKNEEYQTEIQQLEEKLQKERGKTTEFKNSIPHYRQAIIEARDAHQAMLDENAHCVQSSTKLQEEVFAKDRAIEKMVRDNSHLTQQLKDLQLQYFNMKHSSPLTPVDASVIELRNVIQQQQMEINRLYGLLHEHVLLSPTTNTTRPTTPPLPLPLGMSTTLSLLPPQGQPQVETSITTHQRLSTNFPTPPQVANTNSTTLLPSQSFATTRSESQEQITQQPTTVSQGTVTHQQSNMVHQHGSTECPFCPFPSTSTSSEDIAEPTRPLLNRNPGSTSLDQSVKALNKELLDLQTCVRSFQYR